MNLSKTDSYQVSYLLSHTITAISPADWRDVRAIRNEAMRRLDPTISETVREAYEQELRVWLTRRSRGLAAYRKKQAANIPATPPKLQIRLKDYMAKRVVCLFGSQTAMARALGVTQPCVSIWMVSGIPWKWHDRIEFLINRKLEWSL